MTVTEQLVRKVIEKLLAGDDYRAEIITLIDAEFLQAVVSFLREAARAKLDSKQGDADWYRETFLDPGLPSDQLIANAGMNKKTIDNMYNSARREVVLQATSEHYESLARAIKELVASDSGMDLSMTVKMQGVGVDLTISESLLAINTLAVRRSSLRGGFWSSIGKRVEKPLMQALCMLYGVPEERYSPQPAQGGKNADAPQREVDFFLINGAERHRCEIKLMGKGNPEAADATVARDSALLVADKLSGLMKRQLSERGTEWVELRTPDGPGDAEGFRRFERALDKFGIPHGQLPSSLDKRLAEIFARLFEDAD